jgi:multiple sugar transport system substrate-binding protein
MNKRVVSLALIYILLVSACAPAATQVTPTSLPPTQLPPTVTKQVTKTPDQPTAAPTQTQVTSVTITYWAWANIQDQVDEWNQAHPEIFVNLEGTMADIDDLTLQANTNIPDVTQIDYSYLPGFITQGVLANLADYGANNVKDQFTPWSWSQVSQGDVVYAYPQDSGPMVMFCNDAILSEYNISAPTTWDEFSTASAELHKVNKSVYLANFSGAAWFFALLWQAGANPFVINGQNITINFTSPEVTRVAKYWDDLIKSGNLMVERDWGETFSAIDIGTLVCWQAGAWGTYYVATSSPLLSGKFKVYKMPQWTAGSKANGNLGGSVVAVPKASAHPKEAAQFAQWLTTDPKVTLEVTNPDKLGLFPVTKATLANQQWLNATFDYWGGQAIRQVMAEAAQEVNPNFTWSPFTSYVFSIFWDDMIPLKVNQMTLEQVMQDLQTKVTQYAKDKGYTVTNP